MIRNLYAEWEKNAFAPVPNVVYEVRFIYVHILFEALLWFEAADVFIGCRVPCFFVYLFLKSFSAMH